MAVDYSATAIGYRLQGVIDAIDAGGSNGSLIICAGGATLSTISLSRPCGTVDNGVLTFVGTLVDTSAAATGTADNAIIKDSTGTVMVSGLTVGIPLAAVDITISNGLNSTVITAGQSVQLLSAQIIGS